MLQTSIFLGVGVQACVPKNVNLFIFMSGSRHAASQELSGSESQKTACKCSVSHLVIYLMYEYLFIIYFNDHT